MLSIMYFPHSSNFLNASQNQIRLAAVLEPTKIQRSIDILQEALVSYNAK